MSTPASLMLTVFCPVVCMYQLISTLSVSPVKAAQELGGRPVEALHDRQRAHHRLADRQARAGAARRILQAEGGAEHLDGPLRHGRLAVALDEPLRRARDDRERL